MASTDIVALFEIIKLLVLLRFMIKRSTYFPTISMIFPL